MRSDEFLNETLTTPYDYNFDSHVEWGAKVGGKTLKGMTARFATDEYQKYKVLAQKIGLTKAERDAKAEIRKKQDAERDRRDAARAANPDKPVRKKRFSIRPQPYGVPPGGIWEIHFYNVSSQEATASDILGTGDAFRVFATVFAVIEEMIIKGKPEIVSIKSKADEPSRTKLYRRFAKKFAPSLGYRITGERQMGDILRIELRKIDK